MQQHKYIKALGTFALLLIGSPWLSAQNNLIKDTENCSATRPAFSFDVKNAWSSNTGGMIDNRHTPMVGDIDGDGEVEIFVDGTKATNALYNDTLYVLSGKTGALKGKFKCHGLSAGFATPFCIFKRNADTPGCIFIVGKDTIYLYEVDVANSTTDSLIFKLVYAKPTPGTIGDSGISGKRSIPVASDLNGDGKVEVVADKYIFDAETGDLLSTLAFSGGNGSSATLGVTFPIVVDVDGDGLAEVVVGPAVYKFDPAVYINNGFPSSPSPWRICPNNSTADGVNVSADINQDGVVDLVFYTNRTITVWTPASNTIIGSITVPGSLAAQTSYPFVGDIDGIVTNGKKYPEICVNTKNATGNGTGRLYAYSYNGSTFSQKWSFDHSDDSGATILTLFDFNLDGIVELVYRDETHLHIFDGRGSQPVDAAVPIPCGSKTIVETPVIADVTGDGSANIIVTGDPTGTQESDYGEVMVFEGASSKWASCPNVWNQQMYSSLLVNRDLTIPSRIKQPNLRFVSPDNEELYYYNGGPNQTPFISDVTFLPIDLASDVYVIGGSINFPSATSVKLSIKFGNRGMAAAPASTPIQYYGDAIGNTTNIGQATLGLELAPGDTLTIEKVINRSDMPPAFTAMPSVFYVRILDDGDNFPALGAYSDCNLTNNTKSFGTIELLKTVNEQEACINTTRTFTIYLVNNTNLTGNPLTYGNISVTDSLGAEWNYISSRVEQGTAGSFNATSGKILWNVPSLAPGDTATFHLSAKTTAAGVARNTCWVNSIGGTAIEKNIIEAYVIVGSTAAPNAPTITADGRGVCSGNPLALTASGAGEGVEKFQWYKDGAAIAGATDSIYDATEPGSYTVESYNGDCFSEISVPYTVVGATLPGTPNLTASSQNLCGGAVTLTASTSDSGTTAFQWYRDSMAIDGETGGTYTATEGGRYTVKGYNGACYSDMSVPVTLLPPLDLYAISGSIEFPAATSVRISLTFGNRGTATAPASTPIRYYRNAIGKATEIGETTLGQALPSGDAITIVKTFPLAQTTKVFHVRINDDGTNFPALDNYSECNTADNTKTFGSLELTKSVDNSTVCRLDTSTFTIRLVNNTNLTGNPATYSGISVTDSLGAGWSFIAANARQGTAGPFDAASGRLQWDIATLAPGDTATLTVAARTTVAGSASNTCWIGRVGGGAFDADTAMAYVTAGNTPDAPNITAPRHNLCGGELWLNAGTGGQVADRFQWYKDGTAIVGAWEVQYVATEGGRYAVAAYNGGCASALSAPFDVTECALPVRKDASVAGVRHNGLEGNPVAVVFSDNIRYEISAQNTFASAVTLTIRDTLPNYLRFVQGSQSPGNGEGGASFIAGAVADGRDALVWSFPNVAPGKTLTVSFSATPAAGVCASQPLFRNRAWADAAQYPALSSKSNSTYHQGAGAATVTFSAELHGEVLNGEPQAVDFSTAPRSGVLAVPDEGYTFTGWEHGGYRTLKGKSVGGQGNIMRYDTLKVYGNVNLRATFAPEEYPITYHLNGAANGENPTTYTIDTETFTLNPPYKESDEFIGWTEYGVEGTPKPDFTVARGTARPLTLYAHFLRSGSEVANGEGHCRRAVWANGNTLYVNVRKPGSVIRVYNTAGHLVRQLPAAGEGTVSIRLGSGIYFVAVNGEPAQTVRIRE